MCRIATTAGLAWVGVCLAWAGCTRDAPPEIPPYVPPVVAKPVEALKPAPAVESAPPPVVEQRPVIVAAAEAPKPPPVAAPVEVAKPAPSPEPAAPPAPTIIGAWRLVEMIQNGRPEPMPPGMSMVMTFEEGGTVTLAVSGGPMPEAQNMSGTYTLTGDQITITIQNDSKSGTLKFEGNTRAILDMQEVKMTLER